MLFLLLLLMYCFWEFDLDSFLYLFYLLRVLLLGLWIHLRELLDVANLYVEYGLLGLVLLFLSLLFELVCEILSFFLYAILLYLLVDLLGVIDLVLDVLLTLYVPILDFLLFIIFVLLILLLLLLLNCILFLELFTF